MMKNNLIILILIFFNTLCIANELQDLFSQKTTLKKKHEILNTLYEKKGYDRLLTEIKNFNTDIKYFYDIKSWLIHDLKLIHTDACRKSFE